MLGKQDKGLLSPDEKNHELFGKVNKTCAKNEIFNTLSHFYAFLIKRKKIYIFTKLPAWQPWVFRTPYLATPTRGGVSIVNNDTTGGGGGRNPIQQSKQEEATPLVPMLHEGEPRKEVRLTHV